MLFIQAVYGKGQMPDGRKGFFIAGLPRSLADIPGDTGKQPESVTFSARRLDLPTTYVGSYGSDRVAGSYDGTHVTVNITASFGRQVTDEDYVAARALFIAILRGDVTPDEAKP